MSQTQMNTSSNSTLGAQAAAAVAGAPSDHDPEINIENGADDTGDAEGETTDPVTGKRVRGASSVFIVTGDVHEFGTLAKAEKFLNSEGAPATYRVLRGKAVGANKKVTLR